MAHKNSADAKRKSKSSNDLNRTNNKNVENGATKNVENNCNGSVKDEEFIGKFVGFDETDAAIKLSKIHVLKTRSSSEQNLISKTSNLRKGANYLSSSLICDANKNVDTVNIDKVANNDDFTKDLIKIDNNKKIEINVTVSIDTGDDFGIENVNNNKMNKDDPKCVQFVDKLDEKNNNDDETLEDLNELIKAVSHANIYKKNSNVYSVFQAKTLISERRRSIPMIPKMIGQKLNEATGNNHGSKLLFTKSLDESVLIQNHNSDHKDFKAKTIRTISRGLSRLLRRHSSVDISEPDPVFKVAYLGNVLTGWAKGDGCVDKPLGTLWRNYNQSSKPDVVMKLSITNSGLKGITKEHGLTEYWAHRITYCCSPAEYPKVFCWVYRHEGRKLKHELRCHAVLCNKDSIAKRIASELQMKIKQALFEFKRDKISRQNARLSLANAVYDNPSLPRRKILLSIGGNNYKPPLEKSKSAPKLVPIEEMCSEEDEAEEQSPKKNEGTTNTWTKEMSTQKKAYKVEDYFPSYTLGRRKSDKRCLKTFTFTSKGDPKDTSIDESCSERLVETVKNVLDEKNAVSEDSKFVNTSEDNECGRVKPGDSCNDMISSQDKPCSRASFDFSNTSNESETLTDIKLSEMSTDTDEEVFYCETEHKEAAKNNENCQNSDGGSQTNYLILDSDEGSISSGCETASTVTSSDMEMTSLPCNFSQNEYTTKCEEVEERISVLERVQSFEQLFNRERNHSVRNFRSYARRNFAANSKFCSLNRTNTNVISVDTDSTTTDDSLPYTPSLESEPTSFGEEVNLIPMGETQMCPMTFMGRQIYPSDDEANASSFDSHLDYESNDGQDVCGIFDKNEFGKGEKKENAKVEGDSDSACSVESGYSEFLGNAQNDCIIGQTVLV